MADQIWSLLAGVLIIAIIAVLSAPNSKAGAAIKDISTALQAVVKMAVS